MTFQALELLDLVCFESLCKAIGAAFLNLTHIPLTFLHLNVLCCAFTPKPCSFIAHALFSQLFGYRAPATLQVFVGTDQGKVRPHGFYQACKVSGKNSTSCEERDIEGTTVIEIPLDPKDDMTVR